MTAPLLAIENLRTYFYSRAKRAFIRSVDGASLSVARGETLGSSARAAAARPSPRSRRRGW
jgi:ABC-type glutathione transport system ATPase component